MIFVYLFLYCTKSSDITMLHKVIAWLLAVKVENCDLKALEYAVEARDLAVLQLFNKQTSNHMAIFSFHCLKCRSECLEKFECKILFFDESF